MAADAEGESRLRLTRSDYFVDGSPLVSRDGRALAFHYHTCRASGDFQDIVVIELGSLDQAAEAKVVLRTRESIDTSSLRWTAEGKLEVAVNGKKVEIDPSQAGAKQLP